MNNKPLAGEAIACDLPEETQYLTFRVADYLLALLSQQILRVVAIPPTGRDGLIDMGIVQLAQYSIQIIDLPKLLELKPAGDAASDGSSANRFLIVLQNDSKDLWGIAVQDPPDIMTVPNYALKPIPPAQRQTRALRWVSHVVTYDLSSNRHSLPILDLSDLLERQGVS